MKYTTRYTTLFITISLLLVASIVQGQSQKKSMELTLWNWNTDYERMLWEKAQEEYNKLDKEYEVSISYEQIPYTEIPQRVTNNLNNQEALPDILSIEYSQWPEYLDLALSDHFVPLNSIVEGRDKELSEATRREYIQNGNIYALSIQASPLIFAYRKDVMADHDISMPLRTWDDFLQAGKKLKNNGVDIALFDIESLNVWMTLFQQLGGKVFDSKGEYVLPEYSSKAADTFRLLRDMQAGSGMTPNGNITDFVEGKLDSKLTNGSIAGIVHGDWILPIIKDHFPDQSGNWKVQPAPYWSSSPGTGVAMGGTGYALVDKNRRDDTYTEALKDFLNFSVLSFKMQAIYYKNLKLQMTNLELANNKAAILLEDDYFSGQALARDLRKAVKSMEPRYLSTDQRMQQLTDTFNSVSQKIWNGADVNNAMQPLLTLY